MNNTARCILNIECKKSPQNRDLSLIYTWNIPPSLGVNSASVSTKIGYVKGHKDSNGVEPRAWPFVCLAVFNEINITLPCEVQMMIRLLEVKVDFIIFQMTCMVHAELKNSNAHPPWKLTLLPASSESVQLPCNYCLLCV
jgi:hypothetical protein